MQGEGRTAEASPALLDFDAQTLTVKCWEEIKELPTFVIAKHLQMMVKMFSQIQKLKGSA